MRPLVLAHRGASYAAPENTMAAFDAARALGCDGFETDIQLTKDGQMVVSHNYTVDANSNGSGKICSMTLAELKTLDFGSWKGEQFVGERILTFSECLSAIEGFSLVNIELKAPADRTIPYVPMVADAISASGLEEKIIVSAFDHSLLRQMRSYAPKIRLGALTMLLPEQAFNMLSSLESLFPSDLPLDAIDLSTISFPAELENSLQSLGIRAATPRAAAREFFYSLSAMFPGKTFTEAASSLAGWQDLPSHVDQLDFSIDALHPHYGSCLKDPSLIEKMHARNIAVNVWTPDTKDILCPLLAMQPDGIITNRPDTLLELLF